MGPVCFCFVMVDRQHTETNSAMIRKNSLDQSVFHTCDVLEGIK